MTLPLPAREGDGRRGTHRHHGVDGPPPPSPLPHAEGEPHRPPPRAPLLRSRRFLPLFVTQFLGALNDNLFKNALAVLALFQAAERGPVLVAAAGGVFILPYLLFASVAGELADRHDKARLIRLTKLLEIALMIAGALAFLTGTIAGLMLVLFGLGVQATLFSPLKYGILPDHLAIDEIVAGNGYIEAGTYVAILLGTIAGAALIRAPGGTAIVSAAGVAVAGAGLLAACAIPSAPPAAAPAHVPVSWNLARETLRIVRHARADLVIWRCVLGLSWFWLIGLVLLTQFPVVAKDVLRGDAALVTLLLTGFTVGIGTGSILCPVLLRGAVSARHVPWAGFGISLFAWDFANACQTAGAHGVISIAAVLGSATGWRMLADLVLLAACGGLFSVPLYAIIQERAAPDQRARMIAANNVLNAAFMVAGSAVAAGLAEWGMGSPAIMRWLALANLPVAVAILLGRRRR
jgi:acyl-[acyl-carrier-protein]-phospholipid O-acyltransferase/long-chain-fatty-acid--[acyl-carrier-protein] ligase